MAKKKSAKAATTRSQKLRPYVKKVLREAAKHPKRPFLSAFQILDQLEPKVRQKLIRETGSPGGHKAYVRRAASMDVKDAARAVATEIVYLSTSGVEFVVNGKNVVPSSQQNPIALYRMDPTVVRKRAAKAATKKATKRPQASGEGR